MNKIKQWFENDDEYYNISENKFLMEIGGIKMSNRYGLYRPDKENFSKNY